MRLQLPAAVNMIIDVLQAHGYEGFAVGGCVRDSVLNRTPDDWDITTSATPYQVKELFSKTVDSRGLEYRDYGCDSTDSVDYPIYARKVAHAIVKGECERGILICGTGIGISIAANKVPGIRAALCTDCFCAQATREHNDANVLALGGRVVGPGLAIKIVETFLDTPFSNDERHIRRIKLIEEPTDGE